MVLFQFKFYLTHLIINWLVLKLIFFYLTVDRPLMCDCESPRANSVHSLLITIINVSLQYWVLVNIQKILFAKKKKIKMFCLLPLKKVREGMASRSEKQLWQLQGLGKQLYLNRHYKYLNNISIPLPFLKSHQRLMDRKYKKHSAK